MKHLFNILRRYRKECVLAPLFKMFEALMELCVPLVMKNIIDKGIAGGDTAYIIRMTGLLLLLGAAGLGFTTVAQYFSAKAAVLAVAVLRRRTVEHIGNLSYSELDSLGTAALITRLTSDANQVQTGINLTLRLFMRSPFIVFGAMIMAFTVDPRAALTFVAVIPLLSLVVFGIMLISIPLYKKVGKRLESLTLVARENLVGVRVLRAFRREEAERARFSARCQELTEEQKTVGRVAALMNPLTFVLINLAVVVLIYVGALRVDSGVLTQGAVIALYNYMSQILVELIKLANLIITMTKAVACQHRIEAVLDTQSSQQFPSEPPVTDSVGTVEFKGAALRYSGAAEPSVAGVTLSVGRGQTVGIIGGTGSGKTSLVNLIPRFYDCTEGSVFVDGADVRDYPAALLRQKIGLVPQKAVLFSGTVRDNLLWGNQTADDQALWEALTLAQADGFIREKDGLDTHVSQGGKNFSGGQRQRLTIARALVRRPEILILDDSSSALDFATDAALRKALKSLSYDPTVFIVSQRTSALRHADTVLVLDDGEVVGVGSHTKLLETCEIYREIHRTQSEVAE